MCIAKAKCVLSHQILQPLRYHTAWLAFGILSEYFPIPCCLEERRSLKKHKVILEFGEVHMKKIIQI